MEVRVLAPEDRAGFDAAYAVYRDAIEPSEQKSLMEMHVLLARPDYLFLVAGDADAVIGLSVTWVPPDADIWLFEYAAVTPAGRGQGVGALLFNACVALAGEDRIALVEADAAFGDAPSIQRRRLGFYARLGCRRLVGIDYKLPLETCGTPPPMLLLARAAPDIESFPIDDVKRWMTRIYVEVYGRSPDDPRIAEMMAGLGPDVRLQAP